MERTMTPNARMAKMEEEKRKAKQNLVTASQRPKKDATKASNAQGTTEHGSPKKRDATSAGVQSTWQVTATDQKKKTQLEKELQKVIRENPTKEKPKERLEMLKKESHR